MSPTAPTQPRPAAGLPVEPLHQLMLWTLVALIPTLQEVLHGLWTTTPVSPPRAMAYHLPIWWWWLLPTPLIAWLARQFPVIHRRGLFIPLVHLPFSLLLAVAHSVVGVLWRRLIQGPGPVNEDLMPLSSPAEAVALALGSSGLQMGLFAYWGILGVATARSVYGELSDREIENSRLRYRLVQARIRALKTQLQPHFMFNALNAVSSLLIRRDGPSSERMLKQLAEFVRLTLSDDGLQSTLADDVALAERYLSIEQMRFEDRLRFVVRIDPRVADAQVPQLLLQPVVENAVRHGISPRARGGTIEIIAKPNKKRVHIEVRDDGAGLSAGRAGIGRRPDGGIGLSNTRDRLQSLYGDDFGFEISGAPDQGTQVIFDLPYRSEPEPRSEP